MLKKFVEKRLYEHISTDEVGDKYHIENYVDRSNEDYTIMRKHKQMFVVKILFFKKAVWYTTKIEHIVLPEPTIASLVRFDNYEFNLSEKSCKQLPFFECLRPNGFVPITLDTRFRTNTLIFAKRFDNGDFKIIKVGYIKADGPKVLNTQSIIAKKEVIDRFGSHVAMAENHIKLKKEKNTDEEN